MRFALTEAKIVISYLVKNIIIEPSAKTPFPIQSQTRREIVFEAK